VEKKIICVDKLWKDCGKVFGAVLKNGSPEEIFFYLANFLQYEINYGEGAPSDRGRYVPRSDGYAKRTPSPAGNNPVSL